METYRSESISQLISSLVQTVGWNTARVRLGEVAAELDDQLNLCLAIHYGKEREHILSLLQDVFWRLPVDLRIDRLDDALWRTGIHDEVPFLVPSMKAIFRIRNSLAHSVTYSMSNSHLTLGTIKRGKPETTELSADDLNWAVGAAELCKLNFSRIEGRIGGMDAWASLYGLAKSDGQSR